MSNVFSHYRIIRKLGSGGMGDVFLAEDERLSRRVALKVLPEQFTADKPRLLRFEQEAKTVSSLNHPGILTVYEFGYEGAQRFIAAEFIDGETLREKLDRGPLDPKSAAEIAIQIADALRAAHAVRIVHRDIKPENIMIRRDGYAKILDFGVAKLSEPSMSEVKTALTQPGTVIGTIDYMAPEQLRGADVDGRADLFSLGAVLYEMITGRRPFSGESTSDVIVAILERNPDPIVQFSPSVPRPLAEIVTKSLAKNPDARYRTAQEMVNDLRVVVREFDTGGYSSQAPPSPHPSGETATPVARTESGIRVSFVRTRYMQILFAFGLLAAILGGGLIAYQRFKGRTVRTVAVLPFTIHYAGPDGEYLSEGIAEGIINDLSRLPQLQVLALSTVRHYESNPSLDPIAAGRELHVGAVVAGELWQRGDRLIVRAKLVDVEKGTQIWGSEYDRNAADLIAVGDELSEDISSNLRLELSGADKSRISSSPTNDPEAYKLYLKGMYYYHKQNEEAMKKAIATFQQATDRDPAFAMPYAGIALAYYGLSNLYLPPSEAMPRSKAAAERALALDADLADAHTALALVHVWYEWDFDKGDREFRRALELNPADAETHRLYGDYLIVRRRFHQALEEKTRARDLDPISLPANLEVAKALYYAGRLDQAAAQARATLDMDPTFLLAYDTLALVTFRKGDVDQSFRYIERGLQLSGRAPSFLARDGYMLAASGRPQEALQIIDELKRRGTNKYVMPFFLARVYAGLGDADSAMRYLDATYGERSESIVWLGVDSTFDSLRNDQRFQEMIARVGLNR